MTYRVIGTGMLPRASDLPTLAQAAALAHQMAQEGIENVFVFDALGRRVPDDKLTEPKTNFARMVTRSTSDGARQTFRA